LIEDQIVKLSEKPKEEALSSQYKTELWRDYVKEMKKAISKDRWRWDILDCRTRGSQENCYLEPLEGVAEIEFGRDEALRKALTDCSTLEECSGVSEQPRRNCYTLGTGSLKNIPNKINFDAARVYYLRSTDPLNLFTGLEYMAGASALKESRSAPVEKHVFF
jgi:hypothetical protein